MSSEGQQIGSTRSGRGLEDSLDIREAAYSYHPARDEDGDNGDPS